MLRRIDHFLLHGGNRRWVLVPIVAVIAVVVGGLSRGLSQGDDEPSALAPRENQGLMWSRIDERSQAAMCLLHDANDEFITTVYRDRLAALGIDRDDVRRMLDRYC